MWTSHRRLVGALAGSLLLNVFLSGMLFGHMLGARKPPPPVAVGPLIFSRHVKALPKDQQQIFMQAMAPHRASIRSARQLHRDARAKTEADLAAATFDRSLVASDFAALQESNRAVDEVVSAALIDALAGLSQQSRAALLARDAGPGGASPHP